MRNRTNIWIWLIMALFLLCLIFFFLFSWDAVENHARNSDIYYLDDAHSTYNEVLAKILPDYSVGRTTNVYPTLEKKSTKAAEAFDPHAIPALELNVAGYWYPQYLATAIIAVDRDRSDANIRGWGDLSTVNEAVGIAGAYTPQMLFSAIAYGLEGENYTYTGATSLLANLRKNGLLRIDSFEPAIVICYDFQAAALKKSGHNIEIIVPYEGTFSFERGLLSNTALHFPGEPKSLLVTAGFRLPDGRCDSTLYPAAAAYKPAARISDYSRFNVVCQDSDRIFRRGVRNIRLYTSVDGREHQLFPLLYMIILIVWAASAFRRAMQKNVRRAALLTVIILLGWMTARLIKFTIIDETTLGLYLWYCYYLFQLALPLVGLLLADAIDKPENSQPPTWLYALTALNAALIILVFTNNFHGFVFRIDFSRQRWANDYSYGFGYIIIQVVNYALLGSAVIMMLIKCSRSSRKKSFIFPCAFIAVLFLYAYGYFKQVPIARESDFTMVIGLLTLLFFESALRTGLIPVNKEYTGFFTNTSIKIQITSSNGKVALSSASAVEYNPGTLSAALASHPLPLNLDRNTLLFTNSIRGGSVFWQEDITGLNLLHTEINESIRKLSITNTILAEEERVKRFLAEEVEKEQLMTQLEAEIAGYTTQLSAMAQQLVDTVNQQKKAAEIALLLCFVKRRCNLFFWEQEAAVMFVDELTGYLEELAEIASYSDKKITVSSDVKGILAVHHATLFYDFFHRVIDWAAQQNRPHVMAHLRVKNCIIIMRLLSYADPKDFSADQKLLTAITSSGGVFTLEDLDDVTALSLSFPQGGEDHG